MDIQKEKDLPQEAFEVVTDEMGFCLDQKWGDYENPYENSDTALAFNLFKKGWQAKSQAVPEGFVLVPHDVAERCMGHISIAMCHPNNSNAENDVMQMDLDILESKVEAQEQSHDSQNP